jgi:metal-responsive CopG/Arc/MetJ family transcriptional regulator
MRQKREPMGGKLFIRLPDELRDGLDRIAAKRYMTASDVAREAIAEYVARYGNGNGPAGQQPLQAA